MSDGSQRSDRPRGAAGLQRAGREKRSRRSAGPNFTKCPGSLSTQRDNTSFSDLPALRQIATQVYEATLPAVLRWLVRARLSKSDAADVAQEAAMAFWQAMQRLAVADAGLRAEWMLVDATGLPRPATSLLWTILKRRHCDWLRTRVADRAGLARFYADLCAVRGVWP
jgi:hypothetical protein